MTTMKSKPSHNSDERHFDNNRCLSAVDETDTIGDASSKDTDLTSTEYQGLKKINARNDDGYHQAHYYQENNTQEARQQKNNNKNPNNKTDGYQDYLHNQRCNNTHNNNTSNSRSTTQPPEIPQRLFMDTLLKHTAIALAIIIPLAAYSAFATAPSSSENDLFVPLEPTNNEADEQSNQSSQKNNRAVSGSQHMHTLGVPVYADEIYLASEELTQAGLTQDEFGSVGSVVISIDDAPIHARN